MSELHDYFKTQQQAMIDLVTQMVEHESFSTSKADVDVLVEFMDTHFKAMNADSVTRFPKEDVGDCLLAKWNSDAPGKPFLFMGHIDTVHPIGWIKDHPVRHDDEGRIYGPGIVDMKAGNAIAMTAIKGLQERGELPDNPIWFLITTDEEIGSLQSQALIEDTAKDAGLVLVMEPGVSDGGAVKSWRKGTASYRLDVEGRASHAGVAPEEGINAIIEFAQHALEINQLNDLKYGTSVSITMIEGGSAGNVIPANISAHIDVRVMTQQVMRDIDAKITNRQPFMPGAKVTATQLTGRPPMERNADAIGQLKNIGQEIGITVREDGVGGGSDGNFTAAMGIPTLDGLGAVGGGLHAPHEHILISSLAQRAALVAGVLKHWDFS